MAGDVSARLGEVAGAPSRASWGEVSQVPEERFPRVVTLTARSLCG